MAKFFFCPTRSDEMEKKRNEAIGRRDADAESNDAFAEHKGRKKQRGRRERRRKRGRRRSGKRRKEKRKERVEKGKEIV